MTDSRSELMALADCPIGLFYSMDGELCLKTEYGGNNGRIDAYIASSGEFFWGGAKTPGEQRQVFVRPVDLDEANSRLAASQPDREMVARAATQAALTALRAGGDNLAIFNAVRESLSLLSGEVVQKSDGGDLPGLNWQLSDETRQQIAEIEGNSRNAMLNAHNFVAGTPSDPAPGPDVREALNEVITNGEWTEGEQCGEWKISKVVYDLAVEARDAALSRPVGDVQKKFNSDGLLQTEQSGKQPSPAWRVIDTAPHNTSVLLGWRDWRDGQWCMEVGPATTGQRYDNGYSNRSQHGSATHWMPRPEPPDDDAIPYAVAMGDTGGEA